MFVLIYVLVLNDKTVMDLGMFAFNPVGLV